MRIIHLWDICDNSKYISEKLIAMGHQSKVVTRKEYSRKRLLNYYLKVIFHLLTFRADIVHINSWDKGILFAKIFSPRSKIIMHYHGSDIIRRKIPKIVELLVHNICFSTRKLMSKSSRGLLLPVLVPDNFVYTGGREKGTTLVLDQENRMIPYELMPFILSLFEYYRDKKRIKITSSKILSKTGMEAIACGTKVIVDSGEIIENYPMTELKDYWRCYNELCCIGPNT